MKLPNAENAVVPMRKVTEYLLNLENPNGRDKARFFLSFGFVKEDWQVMATALRQHAMDHEIVSSSVRNTFGVNYVIEGMIHSPDGRNPLVRTIWALDTDATVPHFVTAYPMLGENMRELDRIALTQDIPEHHLKSGDVGMIVHVYGEQTGFEVEFVTLNGDFLALVALYPAQIRRIEHDEIAHVRRVQPA